MAQEAAQNYGTANGLIKMDNEPICIFGTQHLFIIMNCHGQFMLKCIKHSYKVNEFRFTHLHIQDISVYV